MNANVPRGWGVRARFLGQTVDELLTDMKFRYPPGHRHAYALHSDLHAELIGEYRAKIMVGQHTWVPPKVLINNPNGGARTGSQYSENVTAGELHRLWIGANRPPRFTVMVTCVHDQPNVDPNINQPATAQPHNCLLMVTLNATGNHPKVVFWDPMRRRLQNGMPTEVTTFIGLLGIGQGQARVERGEQRPWHQDCYVRCWRKLDEFVNQP